MATSGVNEEVEAPLWRRRWNWVVPVAGVALLLLGIGSLAASVMYDYDMTGIYLPGVYVGVVFLVAGAGAVTWPAPRAIMKHRWGPAGFSDDTSDEGDLWAARMLLVGGILGVWLGTWLAARGIVIDSPEVVGATCLGERFCLRLLDPTKLGVGILLGVVGT